MGKKLDYVVAAAIFMPKVLKKGSRQAKTKSNSAKNLYGNG